MLQVIVRESARLVHLMSGGDGGDSVLARKLGTAIARMLRLELFSLLRLLVNGARAIDRLSSRFLVTFLQETVNRCWSHCDTLLTIWAAGCFNVWHPLSWTFTT